MSGRRWIILAVLFAARAATGFQFQSTGSVTNLLMADLGIGYAEVGTLPGLIRPDTDEIICWKRL